MTIVCALHEPGIGTWIGADSRACQGDRIIPVKPYKWLSAGGWHLGLSGEMRSGTVLGDMGHVWSESGDPTSIAKSIRQILLDDGFKNGADEGSSVRFEASFILASPGGVWWIACDFSVFDMADRFCAIGSGSPYAYGAAHALARLAEVNHKGIICAALDAACAHDSGCGGDLLVECLTMELR